jgi:putative transposase
MDETKKVTKRIMVNNSNPYKKPSRKGVRVMGVDLGVNNFAAMATNVGSTPIVIRSRFIKSKNQYYNMRRNELTKMLIKRDGGVFDANNPPKSKRLESLDKKMDNFYFDIFHKMAHTIVDEALANDIDTIVVGKNDSWIEEAKLEDAKNDNPLPFVHIPYDKFLTILEKLCRKNGIWFIKREESYTSKANILNLDDIPTYGENNKHMNFSGVRDGRNYFSTNDNDCQSKKISADVNAAANIARKEFPHAFDNMDLSYLLKVKHLDFEDYYELSKEQLESKKHKKKKNGDKKG